MITKEYLIILLVLVLAFQTCQDQQHNEWQCMVFLYPLQKLWQTSESQRPAISRLHREEDSHHRDSTSPNTANNEKFYLFFIFERSKSLK